MMAMSASARERDITHPLHKRRGKFIISHEALRTRPEEVAVILSQCIVTEAIVRTDLQWDVEYRAISQHFREVEEGFESPLYIPVVKDGEFGTDFVEFTEAAETLRSAREQLAQLAQKLSGLQF